MRTCSTKYRVALLKREGNDRKGKKMLFVTLWDANFCGCIVTDTGFMCEYTDQNFLRLRLETLPVTLKFMCPFSEIFYLVHSLLILLQSLSSFWTLNKTINANLLLIPYSFFSFHLFTCLHCHIMLNFHHEIFPGNLFTTVIKNTRSYPDNDISPIKWWACGQPLDLPKHLGLVFLKISEGRSNASLVLVIIVRSPVHSICKGQLMCLLVEGRQLRRSTNSLEVFSASERRSPFTGITIFQWISLFLQISSLFYHRIQENYYFWKIFHLQSHYRRE